MDGRLQHYHSNVSIIKDWKEVTIDWLKAAWGKLCLLYDNEETSDEGYKFVNNIMETAHDLDFEVEEQDTEELLDMQWPWTDYWRIKEIFQQQCEVTEMEFHLKIKIERKNTA